MNVFVTQDVKLFDCEAEKCYWNASINVDCSLSQALAGVKFIMDNGQVDNGNRILHVTEMDESLAWFRAVLASLERASVVQCDPILV